MLPEAEIPRLLLTGGVGLAAALVSVIALAPLVTLIPFRMHEGWRREFEEMAADLAKPVSRSDFALPLTWKLGLGAIGGVVAAAMAAVYGTNVPSLAVGVYLLGLVVLSAINLKHLLLPDLLVIPMLWAGLLYGAYTGQASTHVYGAVCGYCVPYVLLHAVKASTGKESMGYGDLKAFAMAGAWLGLSALPYLFGTFVVGVTILGMLAAARRRNALVPTGPAHFLASVAYVFGSRLL